MFIALLVWACTLNAHVVVSESLSGIDISTSCTADDFSCFHSAGIDFIIARAWHSYGAFDNSSLINLARAQSAGITENG